MTQSIALPALTAESSLRQYMQDIQKFPMLQADEEYALAKRWAEDGDYEAAHKLVTSHLRLVAKIASGFKGYGLPIVELISEGNIGLMQAVKKFDPDKGFRLSTYAMWWIRASIQEFVLRSWSMVKVGTSAAQKRLFFNLKRMKRQIQATENAVLTPDEVARIAHELEVSERDVVDMDTRMSANDQYLNARVGDDGDNEWIDLLEDDSINQETHYAEHEEYTQKRDLMQEALASLNERERHIIEARRLSDDAMTLEELSHIYNVSRERVRQIEARALEKMTAYVTKEQQPPLLEHQTT